MSISVSTSVFALDSAYQRTALSRLAEANETGASKISHKRKTLACAQSPSPISMPTPHRICSP